MEPTESTRTAMSGKKPVISDKPTEPDKGAAPLLNKQTKNPKYIDMITSVLSESKAKSDFSKQEIMMFISDKYGLTKDAKTARGIRAACERAWQKGIMIKIKYGRDNILYKLDTEVSDSSYSSSKSKEKVKVESGTVSRIKPSAKRKCVSLERKAKVAKLDIESSDAV